MNPRPQTTASGRAVRRQRTLLTEEMKAETKRREQWQFVYFSVLLVGAALMFLSAVIRANWSTVAAETVAVAGILATLRLTRTSYQEWAFFLGYVAALWGLAAYPASAFYTIFGVTGMTIVGVAIVSRWAIAVVVSLSVATVMVTALQVWDDSSDMLGRNDIAITGSVVTVVALIVFYLLLRITHKAIFHTYAAQDDAVASAMQLEKAQAELEAEVERQTVELQSILRNTAKLVAQLSNVAVRDHLTGLYNRRFLDAELPRQVALAQRRQAALCVCVIDLVGFKRVNDQFSHDVGDEVLAQCARSLTNATPDDAYLCRLGGDEFCIILPEYSRSDVDDVLHAYRQALQIVRFTSAPNVSLNFVVGVSCFQADNQQELEDPKVIARRLVHQATEKLRMAKDSR